MKSRTWVGMGMAVGALVVVAGSTLSIRFRERPATADPTDVEGRSPHAVRLHPPAPLEPRSPHAVRLHPPAPVEPRPQALPAEPIPVGRDPQASLLQPMPALAAPEASLDPSEQVTAARLPLPGGASAESPPAAEPPPGSAWSVPRPFQPEATTQSRPAPVGSESAASFSPLEAAPRSHPLGHAALPFVGTHPCTLEHEGVLVLPERLRRQLEGSAGQTLFVLAGPEQSLWFYTAAGLERWAEQLDGSDAAATRVRSARRLCLSQTEACDVDRGGRLHVPERLLPFAGLRQEAVLLGVGDHLELWDAARWQQYRQRHDASAD